jgi:acyl-coenzyme A synthetase/AMP-(fatty) acid ligase
VSLIAFLSETPLEATRPVLLYRGVQLSRGEMFARVQQLADALVTRGLRPGDRVGLSMDNPAIFLTSLLGLAQVGAVGVAVKPAWLSQQRVDPGPKLGLSWLVHDQRELANTSLPASLQIVRARDVFNEASSAHVTRSPIEGADSGLPWLLVQSSGTTGQAKTVVVSQAAMQASLVMGERFQPEDRVMLFLDIAMYWAMANAWRVILAGGVVVPQAPDIPPKQLLQVLRDTQVNVLVMSADSASKLATYLIDFPDHQSVLYLSRVIIGGGRVSAQVMDTLRAHWGASVVVVYGSTEIGPMAVWRHDSENAGAGDYLLVPYNGVQVEVVDAQGLALGVNDVGFLRLRSACMFSGYLDENGHFPLQAPEWFYPGDLASLTFAGHIQLHGRADHVLNLGGRKVNPELIEQVLSSHPKVADVAVTIAAMGPTQVQVLVALVVFKATADLLELRELCTERLHQTLRPEYFLKVSALPRNAAGKLLRQQLNNMIEIVRNLAV